MVDDRKHWMNTMESTMNAEDGENACAQSPLNVRSPVNSHAFPINVNVLALINANPTQITILGTHPVAPLAFPAAKVNNPAPATLFARLKTDVANEAFPAVGGDAGVLVRLVVVDAPPYGMEWRSLEQGLVVWVVGEMGRSLEQGLVADWLLRWRRGVVSSRMEEGRSVLLLGILIAEAKLVIVR